MPFASVLKVGVTGPPSVEKAVKWNVPVMGGVLAELVTVAVTVTLEPKLTLVELAVSAAVVGYTSETEVDEEVDAP